MQNDSGPRQQTSLQLLIRAARTHKRVVERQISELGHEVKVGTGKVNFPMFLKELKKHGFDGSLTIEREIEGDQQTKDILETQKYLSDLIAAL